MKRAIFFYWASPQSPQTVFQQVEELTKQQGFYFLRINTYNRNILFKILFRYFKILHFFNIVIIHNTLSYNPDNLCRLLNSFRINLASFNGLKVLFKQDEMIHVNKTKDFVRKNNIQLLFSCLPKTEFNKIYPKSEYPNLKIINTITGYLNKDLLNRKNPKYEDRAIDVSYRGMKTPANWGLLAREKYLIGEVFIEKVKSLNAPLKLDISSKIEDRISGDNWFNFLASSKACLAVESGASIFDFDDSIVKLCQENGKLIEENFDSFHEEHLAKHEGLIKYNQISPRHIEACATETLLVMFVGDYSGIFSPWENYIPLEKDFSNFDEVLKALKDDDLCKKIISNNTQLIRENKRLHYETFVKQYRNEMLSRINFVESSLR